jgi:DNA integrity scanning protein DisA with diadenylate cyclase activity
MIGIDGATIVDYEGKILAVGAILNISQEETLSAGGGARLAAAKVLSEYGYSLKISEDGEIRAFGKSDKKFQFG